MVLPGYGHRHDRPVARAEPPPTTYRDPVTTDRSAPVADALGRPLRDLRVSVTDRCNFRCRYCMPREVFGPDHPFVPRSELLTFEEITRTVAALLPLGVRKVHLTGGEPLLRRDIETLVAELAGLDGVDDLVMTTNAALLAGKAAGLRAAGLRRLNVSLDSLDPVVFAELADTSVPLQTVLDGIAAASEAGFAPIKLNAVVQRGVNDGGALDLVEYARAGGHVMRFIEYMDVGTTNGWVPDNVVPAAELVEAIGAVHALVPLEPTAYGEVARRYGFADGSGEVGFITSMSQPFCGSCTRLRLTAVGELYTCLFGAAGHDLRALLRGGATDEELAAYVASIWTARADRYSELRAAGAPDLPKVEMSYVGG
jgi:cyclic pyranopterin phosphate synthase